MRFEIDPEFRRMIPPVTDEEKRQLEENILAEGCRDPLVVWNGLLLDGHNRYDICTRHSLPYDVVSVNLPDRGAALDWIDKNQIGRRNLTPDQLRIIRGRRYERRKHDGPGRPTGEEWRQNDAIRTRDALAQEHGVSPRTIDRDAKLVRDLEPYPEKLDAIVQGRARVADVVREIRRTEVVQQLEDTAAREAKALEGVYDVIVIDPPWPMTKIERDVSPKQVEFPYPTMTVEELEALTIPCADDCHVWLWTTQKYLPSAFRLLEAWGLKYVCTFVWHKPGGFQPYGLPQYNAEFALYARRGSPVFVDTKALPACFAAPRGQHSEKPEEFYEIVRRVTAGRRLDMFNRREIQGFDGWGNEA